MCSEGFDFQLESVNGEIDAFSSSKSDSVADHLIIMVNGILGRPTDWSFAAEQFIKKMPDKVIVHCSERNVSSLTLDGIDVMGERLSEEVIEVIKKKPEVRKISFIAHSVGGLVARYAIGKLYTPPTLESGTATGEYTQGTIFGLKAMNFITVASPHLGSRGNQQVPFLFGVPAFEKVASCVIHLIFRRTGRHLFLTDTDEGQPPLLRRMVEDYDDLYFMSALQSFKRRVAYSNVSYDHIVGWRTSSIRRKSELPKLEDSSNELYPHIVREEISDRTNRSTSVEDEGFDLLEEQMLTNLASLSWERVDVSFRNSKFRLAAHSIIQVKHCSIHSDGADVILHMIDRFLT